MYLAAVHWCLLTKTDHSVLLPGSAPLRWLCLNLWVCLVLLIHWYSLGYSLALWLNRVTMVSWSAHPTMVQGL